MGTDGARFGIEPGHFRRGKSADTKRPRLDGAQSIPHRRLLYWEPMKPWIVLACCLAGCATPASQSWVKPDANDVDLRTALVRCRSQAANQPLAPKVIPNPDPNSPEAAGLGAWGVSMEDMASYRKAISDCMADDGWTRR
jgi:hypothetical protein